MSASATFQKITDYTDRDRHGCPRRDGCIQWLHPNGVVVSWHYEYGSLRDVWAWTTNADHPNTDREGYLTPDPIPVRDAVHAYEVTLAYITKGATP